MHVPCDLFLLLLLPALLCGGVHAADSITASTPLLANQTLLSPSQTFELGFFSPNGSQRVYVGVWYKKPGPLKVVWVANRERPIAASEQSSASLGIGADGNLRLVDGRGSAVWSTNVSAGNHSFASISDSGNFTLQDERSDEVWASFRDPTDTLLPGMSIRVNMETGITEYLTSWRSENDPSPGAFKTGVTLETPTQPITWKGSEPYWRGGQWDKSTFIGIPDMTRNYWNDFTIEQDAAQGTLYFSYQPISGSFYHLSLSPEGLLLSIYWDDEAMTWATDWQAPRNQCDIYGSCGPFGVCNDMNVPICSCMDGFVPSSANEWNRGNWSKGCVRQMELNCQKPKNASSAGEAKIDSFLPLSNVKLPDSASFQADIQDARECRTWCLKNCSCLSYSYVDSIGCMTWSEDLLDIEDFGSNYGEALYVRVTSLGAGRSAKSKTLIISLTIVLAVAIVGAATLLWWNSRSKRRDDARRPRKNPTLLDLYNRFDSQGEVWKGQLKPQDASDLPIYSFDSIVQATNNFDISNKLGQGGFGSVYKGKLDDGRVVAVKRLASSSSQGIEEFRNEVILISKLQHRNLVRLIGWCIESEEQILLYEYLPNKSLDTFLFDAERKAELSWSKRFSIIQGIARGLLYLHKDSSLRIIHRDLKVSNILLDEKMNPKISDFGLARMFEGTLDLVNTRRVVGTLGYMSPEYAMGGVFSEKSDVYSFGVLLLEIISGKKNRNIRMLEDHINLLSYAWELWSVGRGMDLVDGDLNEVSAVEVMRCIQVSLLCVQDQAAERPNMAAVVPMLSGEFELPRPKRPAFTFQSVDVQSNQSSIVSANSVTNSTLLEGR